MKRTARTPREEALYNAIRDLSLPGKEALEGLATGRGRADAMALCFDEQYTGFMENMTTLPGESQLLSLQQLDAALNAISGPENLDLWTDASFANDPLWADIRALARQVLIEFDW